MTLAIGGAVWRASTMPMIYSSLNGSSASVRAFVGSGPLWDGGSGVQISQCLAVFVPQISRAWTSGKIRIIPMNTVAYRSIPRTVLVVMQSSAKSRWHISKGSTKYTMQDAYRKPSSDVTAADNCAPEKASRLVICVVLAAGWGV